MYSFLISSAIETSRGMFTPDERLAQTIETVASIRRKIPDANIVIYELGATLSKERFDELVKHANVASLQAMPDIVQMSASNLISFGEAAGTFVMLHNTQTFINENTKRIFKLSGRYFLQDSFDISAYENIGDKYVFKKHVASWLPQHQQQMLNATGLFDTRLYSFTPALIEDYKKSLEGVIRDLGTGLDLEHAIYKNINKDLVVEFDKVHCEGRVAPDGTIRID